jgi:pyruvate kinase
MRKTKIIVTIGPKSENEETLDRLLAVGMDCARLNFAHATPEWHGQIIHRLRDLSRKRGRPVAILQDVAGIKFRLGEVKDAFQLNVGEETWLVPEDSSDRPDRLPFPYAGILRDLQPGNLVYIADGAVCLEVTEVQGSQVRTRVLNAGTVSSRKGVNLPGAKIDLPVLTDKDKIDLKFGVEQKVDWVAISFVRTAEDIRQAKEYLKSIGSDAQVMVKLEKMEGVQNIDAILEEVNAVMVARGDLGVEVPMQTVPTLQKNVVRKANEAAKISIIATQMLLSMIESPRPTRAEISDVANAVWDGCDAIMLSDETTVGKHPVEVVQMADAAIREAEKAYLYHRDLPSHNRTQAIAGAASDLVRALQAKPIVLTSTGRAAFEVSRYRPGSDIIVFSHDEAILRRVCLGWGLAPMGVIPAEQDVPKLVRMVMTKAVNTGLVTDSDVVTIVHGFLPGVSGTTNTIQVLGVKEYFAAAPPASPEMVASTRR